MKPAWEYRPGRALWCPFWHENPEPPPECVCECKCACSCSAADWIGVVYCPMTPRFRVMLTDGRWMDCCSADAHGVAPVEWAARLVGPTWEPPLHRALKYLFPVERIGALAELDHPLFEMFPALKKVEYSS